MKTSSILKASAIAVTVAALAGCATSPLSGSRFSHASNLTPQLVQTGTVIKTQPIRIKDSAFKKQNTGIGAVLGGGIGEIVGGTVGAMAGLVGGGLTGDLATSDTVAGTDIFVKMTGTGQILSIPEAGKVTFTPGEQVAVSHSGAGHYRVSPMTFSTPGTASGKAATGIKTTGTSRAPGTPPALVKLHGAQINGQVALTTASPWARNRARQEAGN